MDRFAKIINNIESMGKSLKEIPSSILKLKNLKILDLNFNNIKTIPNFMLELEKKGLIIYK